MRNTLATLLLALALAPVGATATAPAAPSVAPVAIDGVDWFRGELFAIRAKAKAEGKGVLFVVHSQDSSWCKKLFQTTLQDAGVLVELEDLVCVEVDLSRDEEGSVIDVTSEQIAARFPVRSFPTVLYLGPSLIPDDLMEGFVAAAPFLAELQRMKSGVGTLSDLRAKREAAPDDVEAIWNLAAKCYDLGYASEHAELMARIRELDPEGRSKPVRTVALQILEEQLFREYTASGTYDYATLTAFLEDEPNPDVAFQGWSTLAGLSRSLRDTAADKKQARAFGALSRDAYQRAWEVVPATQKAGFIAQAILDQYADRAELKGKDRRFVRELAEALDDALETALAGQSLTKVVDAQFCEVRACAAFLDRDLEAAERWIDRAIELDPSTAGYAARRDELTAGGE